MSDYELTIQNNTVIVLNKENCVVYDFGEWEKQKVTRLRGLLSHKKDLDYAKEYLNQMFFDEGTSLIDGALINSAIQLLVKSFSNPSNGGRFNLNPNKVFRIYAKKIGEEDLCPLYCKFADVRNQVLAHDQSTHRDGIIGLVIDENTGKADGVVGMTINTTYLYRQNQQLLLRLINVVNRYVCEQIDEIKEYLVSEYNNTDEKPNLDRLSCSNTSMTTAW